MLKPIGAATSGGHDDALGVDALFSVRACGNDASANIVLDNHVAALGAKAHLDAGIAKMVLDCKVELLGLLGTEVANGAVDHLEACLDGAAANVAYLRVVSRALDVLVGTKGEVDLVHLVDGLLRLFGSDQFRKVAADLVGQGELSVRERACARKARGDIAGLAIYAVPGFIFGAMPPLYRKALFQQDDMGLGSLIDELEGCEDACRAGTDDDDICVHGISPHGMEAPGRTLLSRGNALNMLIIRLHNDKERQLERAVFPVNNGGGGYCSADRSELSHIAWRVLRQPMRWEHVARARGICCRWRAYLLRVREHSRRPLRHAP